MVEACVSSPLIGYKFKIAYIRILNYRLLGFLQVRFIEKTIDCRLSNVWLSKSKRQSLVLHALMMLYFDQIYNHV